MVVTFKSLLHPMKACDVRTNVESLSNGRGRLTSKTYVAGCQNIGSGVRPYYPIYIGARIVSILWAYHACISAKCKIKYRLSGRRSNPGPFFQSSVLSVVSLLLTSSRLSRLRLGDLKCSLLGWPASQVAGWLASG